ncbi:MAG: hypothetical protein WBA44_18840 [Mesorhizobium sp.]
MSTTTSNHNASPRRATGVAPTATGASAPRLSRPRFALLILLGVYPLITCLLYVIMPLTNGWSLWERTLVIAPLMVGLMVWGVIPAVQHYGRRFILR